jgi:hypothetical protein
LWAKNPRVVIGGIAGVVVLLGIVLAAVMSKKKDEPTKQPNGNKLASKDADSKDKTRRDKDQAQDKDQTEKDKDKTAAKDKDKKTGQKKPKNPWPVLYKPSTPLDMPKLFKEYAGPWAKSDSIPKDALIYQVGRILPPKANPKFQFDTLSAACAAAPPGKMTIIQIFDNGPLFETPIAVTGKSLQIRAADGYRPLLVWDLEKWKARAKKDKGPEGMDQPAAFLSVEEGNLQLGGLDVALDWPEDSDRSACLVRVSGGDFLGWNDTFSIGGQYKGGTAVVRFEAPAGSGKKCKLKDCFCRGGSMVALDALAPGTDLMLENCLVVGGNQPVVRCQGGAKGKPTTLRVVRSSLTARKSLFQVAGGPSPTKPLFSWMGWDALLVRIGAKAGGVLLDIADDASADNLKWRAVNCLYSGWLVLLSGRKAIPYDAVEKWRQQWKLSEGDKVLNHTWPIPQGSEIGELHPYGFATAGKPIGFAATLTDGLLGTSLWDPAELKTKLLWVRSNWKDLGYRRFSVPEIDVLKEKDVPEFPGRKSGPYAGGRIDLNKTDLGAFLKKQKLATSVALHLHGSGPCKCSPIYLRNVSLKLYFEPASRRGAKPLVLVPNIDPKTERISNGFIEVENGQVDIMGGTIRCGEIRDPKAKFPHYLLFVWGGNLRMHGTRLQGPPGKPPDTYWGLIRMEGSGRTEASGVYGCTLHQSVLVSSRIGVHVSGVGARVRLQDCVVVSGTDGIRLQPGPAAPAQLNVQCILENNTFAARGAAIYVEDTPQWFVVAEPVIIQSQSNAFLNPFTSADGKQAARASVILYDGIAVPRGVLDWQGEGDFFDKRLFCYAAAAGAKGILPKDAPPQTYATWEHLWGSVGNTLPVGEVALKNTIDLDKPKLEQLALPDNSAFKGRTPGANLERLGVLKKTE